MIKIALCGGPGTGKTTCAAAFTAHMNSQHKPFYHITEYARCFIDTYGSDALMECGPLIQLKFAEKQRKREDEIPDSIIGFITDSPTFIGWFYAALYGGSSVSSYIARKDNYKTFLKGIYSYDFIFLIGMEGDYVDDGCRYQDRKQAELLNLSMQAMLLLHGVKFTTLNGSTPDRVKKICETIEAQQIKI